MYRDTEITLNEHKEWFYSMLPNKDSEWHVLSVNKLECAIIYFTRIKRGNSCSLGFYASGKAPLGVGIIIELAGLTYAFETLKVHHVECEVVSGNYQVINLHKRTGFKQEGTLRKAHNSSERGIEDVIVFGMTRDRWEEIRFKLQEISSRLQSRD